MSTISNQFTEAINGLQTSMNINLSVDIQKCIIKMINDGEYKTLTYIIDKHYEFEHNKLKERNCIETNKLISNRDSMVNNISFYNTMVNNILKTGLFIFVIYWFMGGLT
jgi:hypothetical protein